MHTVIDSAYGEMSSMYPPASHAIPQTITTDDDPIFTLRRVAESIERHLDDALMEHGLRSISWCILLRLSERDGENTTTLASRTAYDRSSVVRALEGLARRKLVRREHHSSDRRNRIIHLTRSGLDTFRRAATSVRLMREDACRGMSEFELDTVLQFLRRLLKNLDAQRGQTSASRAS
jgi:DNA-binding MarR family transcriptional regulator